ncbi:MAG TPA: PRC-barrel domain-containing protein [Candidatus Gracilibacteria bacterium]
MLTHFKEAIGTWVHAKDSAIADVPLGKVCDMVVNPDTAKIEAFWVKGNNGFKLLSPQNIVHWNQMELLIGEETDLVDPEGMPALRKILEHEVKIIGAPVYGKVYGKYLGKVRNFAFHTISPSIVSLRVESGWALFGARRIIPRSRIIDVKKNGIWISDQALETPTKDTKIGAENVS